MVLNHCNHLFKNVVKSPKQLYGRVRHIKGAALGTLGFCTSWAVDTHGIGSQWIQLNYIDIPITKLPAKLVGKTIVQVSDLHCSRTVSGRYLKLCIDRINSIAADVVVLTGDYITHDINGKYRKKAVDLIAQIQSRYGIYACLGNHDYGIGSVFGSIRYDLLKEMTDYMSDKNITVLRNESAAADIDGQPLWLAGLGDIWVDDFRPDLAFADVPAGEPTVVLAHNPDTAGRLSAWPASVILSGHTHGGKDIWQIKPSLKVCSGRYHSGMYELNGSKLYVNRGLGRLGRVRLHARPEITIFKLKQKF